MLFDGKGSAWFSPSVPRLIVNTWVDHGGSLDLSFSQSANTKWYFCDGKNDPCVTELWAKSLVVLHAAWVLESVSQQRVIPVSRFVLDDRFTPLKLAYEAERAVSPISSASQTRLSFIPNQEVVSVATKRPLDSPDLRINPRPVKKMRFYEDDPISASLNSPHQRFADIRNADKTIFSKPIQPCHASVSKIPSLVHKSKAANISSMPLRNGYRHDDTFQSLTTKTQVLVNGANKYTDNPYDALLTLLRVPAKQASLEISVASLLHAAENIPPANAVLFDPRHRYLGKRFTCCKRESVR